MFRMIAALLAALALSGPAAAGHVLTVARADGASSVVTRWFYSPTGQVRSVVDPNGNTTVFAYDADDRLASATDPVGRTTTYAYDALNRLSSVGNAAIQATPLESFTYSPDGYLASLTDADSNTTSFAYDGFDRLSVATYPDTSTEQLAYDADSNVTSFGTRRGDTITFAYDTLNRLTTKTPPSGTATVDYAYDLDSRLVSANDNSTSIVPVAAPGGTTASYATTLAYDQLNRPTEVSWTPAPAQATPASSSATLGFAYDASNRRIGETSTDSSWITYPTTATSVSYRANDLNQYSGVGAYSPTYDGDGNLTFDGTFTYAYDAESRLTSVSEGGTGVASYAYDAQGRRKLKTVGATSTVYVTDADGREVLEYNGTSGAVGRWYAYGTGPTEVLGQMNVALSTRETMVPDIQGSIVATLDSGSGVVTKSGFWPFGENPAATTQTFGYAGERFDPETASGAAEPSGLYYDRARTYSPTLGRFFQPDPIGYAGGANLYAYVNNDPLDLVDLSGLAPDNSATAVGPAGLGAAPPAPTPRGLAGGSPLNAGAESLTLAAEATKSDDGINVVFGQRRASPFFSDDPGVPSYLSGRSIAEVANDLKNNIIGPDQIAIQAFSYSGQLVSANTRSLAALSEVGLIPTNVTIIEPNQELLNRLVEIPLLPDAQLPGPLLPLTPSRTNLTIIRIIEIPGFNR